MSARSWFPGRAALTALVAAAGLLAIQAPRAEAQVAGALPPPPADGGPPAGEAGDADYLLRGPLHEAFGEPVQFDPEPGLIVPKAPPEPVNEIPAETKPEGDPIWISGYWAWDDQREDFLWVSGGYRLPPPDRRWVPGYWQQVESGYQWIGGFWAPLATEEVTYLPEPPASLERGPSSPSPSDDYFWVTGYWNYTNGNYAWRPGYWTRGHENWVWTPTHYVWTPRGCVNVPGYWDHGLVNRGWLFSPVYWRTPLYAQAGFSYRPYYAVDFTRLYLHLFVRPGYSHYYFGDWYGSSAQRGVYSPFAFHGRYGYDPLWTYYRWHFGRQGIDYSDRVRGWHRYYERHEQFRPPHTWHNQQQFIRDHRDYDHLRDVTLGEGLRDLASRHGHRGVRLDDEARQRMHRQSQALRELAEARRGGEGHREHGGDRDSHRGPERMRLPDTPGVREARQRMAEREQAQSRDRAATTLERDRLRGQFGQRFEHGTADALRRQTDDARALRERITTRDRASDGPRHDTRGDFPRSQLSPQGPSQPESHGRLEGRGRLESSGRLENRGGETPRRYPFSAQTPGRSEPGTSPSMRHSFRVPQGAEGGAPAAQAVPHGPARSALSPQGPTSPAADALRRGPAPRGGAASPGLPSPRIDRSGGPARSALSPQGPTSPAADALRRGPSPRGGAASPALPSPRIDRSGGAERSAARSPSPSATGRSALGGSRSGGFGSRSAAGGRGAGGGRSGRGR